MKFSILTKLNKAFGKYGGYRAPYYILKWKIGKVRAKRNAKKVLTLNPVIFEVTKTASFFDLYTGSIEEEGSQILNGERKILFYNSDDNNSRLDIKTKWELSRNHHAPILAIYSRYNDDAVRELATVFNKENYGEILHDSNAMEVGIATINLILTYQELHVQHKAIFGSEFYIFLRSSLSYILDNNEKSILYSNNHYFFNVLGVLWICEFIAGNQITRRLKSFYYNQLYNLLNQMILDDGALYEASTHYHKYITEALLLFMYFKNESGEDDRLIKYAKKMYGFCVSASVNGRIVGVGDNDSGRVLALPSYFHYESCSLEVIHNIAEKIGFKSAEIVSDNSDFGLFRIEKSDISAWVRLEEKKYRPYRKTICSHAHNDQLSIQLFINRIPILIDKGVYSYIGDEGIRLENMKTSAHNTVAVNDWEQDQIYNDWRYSEKNSIGTVINKTPTIFTGCLDVPNKYQHTRMVSLEEDKLLITDLITHRLDKAITVKKYFHFHHDVRLSICSDGKALCTIESSQLIFSADTGKFCIEDDWYAPEYGIKQNSKMLVLYTPLDTQSLTSGITISKK